MSRFLHSYSASFGGCPFAFKCYQQGTTRSGEHLEARFGQAFHEIADGYLKHCVRNQRTSDVSVLPELIRMALDISHLPTSYLPELQDLTGFWVDRYEVQLDKILATENKIALNDQWEQIPWTDDLEYDNLAKAKGGPMRAKGQTMFRAKLDLVEFDKVLDRLTITDFKTTRGIISESAYTGKDLSKPYVVQMGVYAWLAFNYILPVEPVYTRLHYVRYNVVREVAWTAKEIRQIGEILRNTITYYEDLKKFDARPGKQCNYCDYLHKCPVKRRVRSDGVAPIGTSRQAQKAQRELAIAERMVADRKAALKDWVQSAGPVVSTIGIEYADTLQQYYVLHPLRALDWLENKGIPEPIRLFTLPKDNVDWLPEYEDLVEVAGVPQYKTVFGAKQLKADLVKIAEDLGIEDANKMKVAELKYKLLLWGDQK